MPGPLYPAVPHLLPLFHAAFSTVMAEGTLDDLVMLARTGRQQYQATTPMQESEASHAQQRQYVAGGKLLLGRMA